MTSSAVEFGSGRFRYRVQDPWAKVPAKLACKETAAVACDSADRVYLFTRGPDVVQVYEPDGTFGTTWGEGLFSRAHGLFIGPDDTVYCTDDFDHTVRAFTRDGKLKFTIGTSGRPSDTGATSTDYRTIRRAGPPFHYPTNLAIAPSGELYVTDGYGNARVHRFSPDGKLIASWGEPGSGPGQFHLPHGIAIDAEGIVYVADRENCRIQFFSPTGDYLGEWKEIARPCQVFIDPAGIVYVAEVGLRAGRWPGTGDAKPGDPGGRVSIFDRKGTLLARWGGGDNPTAPGDFFAPHGIWVDKQGAVYVSEVVWSAGGRIGAVPPTCHSLQKFVRKET